MMRDSWKSRAGYDRVLMTVAATFLTVSATSALAQSDQVRNSAAELAIDAAIPRPEPANLPPPTINDFKLDTLAPPPPAKVTETAAPATEPAAKPANVATAPLSEPSRTELSKTEPSKTESKADKSKTDGGTGETAKTEATATEDNVATRNDTANTTPAEAPVVAPASPEPVKAASNVAPADQPVADRLHEVFGGKSLRYFDRKAERAAVEKFYTAREFAPIWTQAGKLTDSGKGAIARLRDAASDGLNPSDYPLPDFAARPRRRRLPTPT